MKISLRFSLLAAAALAVPGSIAAQNAAPESLLPEEKTITGQPVEAEEDVVANTRQTVASAFGEELVQPIAPAIQPWSTANAEALLAILEGIGADGLDPADYQLPALTAALAAGEGEQLDALASESFSWLIEDLRDGRTPMNGRKQWFVFDPDADRYPTNTLMARALDSGDLAATLTTITPEHPDYELLKAELAKTPATQKTKRKMIIANMDRWRWLARDLGNQYLMTNVPEFQLRLTVNDKIVRTYRTVVGKPGRTATPQLAESVEGVIFNPTWTVPQSIVKGEGLGARVLGNPAWAQRAGYKATKGANGWVSVVQQPGPGNSLGLMKLDMPNRHAIFLHDTPSRHLFGNAARALSHGCIRTERATELAITLAILQGGKTAQEGVDLIKGGKYTRVTFQKSMPVYITYFTMAKDIDGKLATFKDIYGRDAAVIAAFNAPRKADRSRVTGEQIIVIEDDLQTT